MEVILKKDMSNLGYENDIVKVKNGYARNYLLPKGLAVVATESAKKVQQETLRQKAHKEEKLIKDAEDLAKALEEKKVKIGAKAGSTGKIFGSVNAMQIADAIKEQLGYEVDRKKISIDGDAVKNVGEYTAKLKLHKEVTVEINFEVYAE
ncbi:MAG: 50S ribosomal protein L9 [Bacteroidales bacterium]|nr:50S ribosomal protein L9 [Bacteroidales bacterium]MCF8326787.1 50S ribosomal protein L9 [Bacteroidales bacterium]